MKTSTISLLPCPFCGGDALFVEDDHCDRFVECVECGASTAFYFATEDETIADAWNRRTGKKVAWLDRPFAIGDVIEPSGDNPFNRKYLVIRETSHYMTLECRNSNIAGMRMNRHKNVLKRDWRRVCDVQ